ncbi:MAG: hypothetical protein K2L06_02080 [Alistipes sp.]|nr:hypothetical protein [Alistipes sp.]
MKKLVIIVACLLAGYSAAAFGKDAERTESVRTVASDWEDYTTVTVLQVGRSSKVRIPNCKVQRDYSGGSVRYRVYHQRDWHEAYRSDRSDYAYMFYAGSAKCYFNL